MLNRFVPLTKSYNLRSRVFATVFTAFFHICRTFGHADSKLDENLVEGLKQAKKAPRNFALIVKGAAPVKLLVRKKKIKDAELLKAKTEAKGTDFSARTQQRLSA